MAPLTEQQRIDLLLGILKAQAGDIASTQPLKGPAPSRFTVEVMAMWTTCVSHYEGLVRLLDRKLGPPAMSVVRSLYLESSRLMLLDSDHARAERYVVGHVQESLRRYRGQLLEDQQEKGTDIEAALEVVDEELARASKWASRAGGSLKMPENQPLIEAAGWFAPRSRWRSLSGSAKGSVVARMDRYRVVGSDRQYTHRSEPRELLEPALLGYSAMANAWHSSASLLDWPEKDQIEPLVEARRDDLDQALTGWDAVTKNDPDALVP